MKSYVLLLTPLLLACGSREPCECSYEVKPAPSVEQRAIDPSLPCPTRVELDGFYDRCLVRAVSGDELRECRRVYALGLACLEGERG